MGKQYQDASDGMVNVEIDEQIIIDPYEAAMVKEEIGPKEFVRTMST